MVRLPMEVVRIGVSSRIFQPYRTEVAGSKTEANAGPTAHRTLAARSSMVLEKADKGGRCRASKPDGYLLGSYRIATAPDENSTRLTSFKSTCFDSPANKVGPWPAILG